MSLDPSDLEALKEITEAIKAACAGGRPVKSVKVHWISLQDDAEFDPEIRPTLEAVFGEEVPVGEAVGPAPAEAPRGAPRPARIGGCS